MEVARHPPLHKKTRGATLTIRLVEWGLSEDEAFPGVVTTYWSHNAMFNP